jgi:hypothetical protein
MRRTMEIFFAGLLLCLCGCGDSSSATPPSEAEARSALAPYLVAEHQKHCQGSATLDRLSVTRVGRYEQSMGGYPIFAALSTTCRHGGSSETFNGMGSANAAAAYLKKTAFGPWEAYMPDVFRQAQTQMNRQMEEMLKKAQPS